MSVNKYFKYMVNPISNFGFIPMDDEIAKRYRRGLTEAYHRLQPTTDSQRDNRRQAIRYLQEMRQGNPKVFTNKTNLDTTDNYLLPIVHSENGKKRTIGLRDVDVTYDELPDYTYVPIATSGRTVTHPKSGNVGADGLVQTMIEHADSTKRKYPALVHSISGSNKARKRLYQQKASKYIDELPDNLEII